MDHGRLRWAKKEPWMRWANEAKFWLCLSIKALWSSAGLRTSEALSNYHVWVSHSKLVLQSEIDNKCKPKHCWLIVDWEATFSQYYKFLTLFKRGKGVKGFLNNLKKITILGDCGFPYFKGAMEWLISAWLYYWILLSIFLRWIVMHTWIIK